MTLLQSTPAKPVTLLPLTPQPNVGFALPIRRRLARMLRSVKDENIAGYCLGSDQVCILRHVSSTVDLMRMVDALDDLDARWGVGIVRPNFCGGNVIRMLSTSYGRIKLTSFFLIVIPERISFIGRGLWQDHFGNHQVVLSGPGSVCAEDHAMFGVVCIGGTAYEKVSVQYTFRQLTKSSRLHIRQPLAC